jgi:hypothetical protein
MKGKKLLILQVVLGASLILLAIFSALPVLPPRVIPADAPATRFSAERAMADLEVVARQPHAAGTTAQERVRNYIVGQVEALGLIAEIETSSRIANILIRLPGTDSTQTVLITGHYDSHPPAPGAGDNGISTVAMLESIRVLQASQTLRNDVLFLFTDGEELSWLGARAFLKQHPASKEEIGVVLVFDARPGNGPLTLLETSPGDAWLVRQMTGLPLSLWAGSWNNREERAEQDTDFDIFQPAGLTGAAFENEASGTRYHTNRDTVDAISPNLVQSYGQSIIALTRRFGTIDLSTRTESPDAVYFTLPLVGIVAYPGWLMLVLSSLGILALIVFVIIAWRRSLFSPGYFGLSLLGLALGIGLIVLCAQLAWGGVKNHYAAVSTTRGIFEASSAWLTWMMLGAALLMIFLLVFLSHRLGGMNLLPAAVTIYLLVWFAVYFLMDADNPFTTAYIAWPLLGGVAGLGVLLFTKNPVHKVVLLAFCALAILVLQVPYLWLGRYTSEDAWIPVLAACIPMGLFVPQVEAIFGRALK